MTLLRSSAFVLGASAMQFLASLGSGIILARALGPEGKGEVAVVTQFAAFASLFLSLGLGPSYQYHLGRKMIPRGAVLGHSLLAVVVNGCVLVALYIFLPEILRWIAGSNLSNSLIIVGLVLAATQLTVLLLGSILMATPKGTEHNSIYNVVSAIAYVGALVACVIGWKLGVVGALLAVLAGMLVRLLLCGRLVFGDGLRSLSHPGLDASRRLLSYGLKSMLGNLMLTSVLRIDTFLVNAYSGAAELGIYSVAVSMGELLMMLPSSVGIAFFPYLNALDQKDQTEAMCAVARTNVLVGSAGSILVALLGYPVIILLFGSRFAASFTLLLWLLPGLVAMAANYAFTNYMSSRGRPEVNALVFGAGVVVNVAVNLVLIPRYGAIGAAASSTLAYLGIGVAFVLLLARLESRRPTELFLPTRDDLQRAVGRLRKMIAPRNLSP